MVSRILFFVTTLMASVAQGDTLIGRVIKVSDGDTLTILDTQNQQFKIRLAGIDAPEKSLQALQGCLSSHLQVEKLEMPRSAWQAYYYGRAYLSI